MLRNEFPPKLCVSAFFSKLRKKKKNLAARKHYYVLFIVSKIRETSAFY